MARSVPWRHNITDTASWRQDQGLNATIYILRETGPTGFLLKEEGESKKFKVFLGDPHKCTCSTFTKEKDLCKHICWLLLKKFRIPRTNPTTWQLGLVEREINEMLHGRMAREETRRPLAPVKKSPTIAKDGRTVLEQRDIADDDVCPICQEGLLSKHEPVTYCKFGCANSIHIKCMKVWAEHQKSSNETCIKCPFCREDFGPFDLLKQEFHNASVGEVRRRADEHYGIECNRCRIKPISGKCYKCSMCFDYHLCQDCFNTQTHTEHSFNFRQKSSQRWRPAHRGSGSALPSAVVNSLMNRDISDGDYDLLLQLDSSEANRASDIPEDVIKSFPTERIRENSKLLAPGQQCRICLRGYQVGQQLRRLPACKHKFHIECIDNWLLHEHATCPIDGQMVWNALTEQLNNSAKPRKTKENKSANNQQEQGSEIMLEVPGIRIAYQGTTQAQTSSITSTNQAKSRQIGLLSQGLRNIPNSGSHIPSVPLPHQQVNLFAGVGPLDSNRLDRDAASAPPVVQRPPAHHNRFKRQTTVESDPEMDQGSHRSRGVNSRRPTVFTDRRARSFSGSRQRAISRDINQSGHLPTGNPVDLFLGHDPRSVSNDFLASVFQRSVQRRGSNLRPSQRPTNQFVPSHNIELTGTALSGLTLGDLI